jgi:epoxyqueuosine reductase
MDYLPNAVADDWRECEQHRQADPDAAVISVYARGRDYHKVMRSRLQRLVDQISIEAGPIGYRVFTDSAPVMEVALAQKAGLGWRGKHTLLLNRDAGSMFFLGVANASPVLTFAQRRPLSDLTSLTHVVVFRTSLLS